jgi:flagellar hook-associated protein 1 FlgK
MGTMEMARNAMQTARQGAEVAGHNLANASNPTYARQRVKISAAVAIPTDNGPQGSGSEVSMLEQIRDYAIDKALVSEKSITKYLEAKQRQLHRAEASLGQTLDRQSIDAGESYGSFGVAEGLASLFSSFQSLSANPTSTAERQTVVFNAQKLADKMNIVDRRLGDLRNSINDEVEDEVANINMEIESVALLAASLGNTETVSGAGNEIKDALQASLEELSEYVNVSTTTNEDGKLSLFVDGYEMVTDNAMTGSVKLYTDTGGMNFLADNASSERISLQSGSVKGLIDVRDDSIKDLQDQLNTLASNLITEVNALHQTGFNLSGVNDGSLTFFTGTNASDIGVDSAIISDPRLLQAAGTGEVGDNTVIRAMAEVGDIAISGLSNMTFSEHYGNTISRFGQDMALTDTRLIDQQSVQTMLEKQRDSVQGVSIDEEVANLIIYQRAFQASARLISTMDTLMNDVLNLQR